MNENGEPRSPSPGDARDYDVERVIRETAARGGGQPRRTVRRSGYMRLRVRDVPETGRLPRWAVYAIVGAAVLLAAGVGLLLHLNRGVKVIDLTGWALEDARLWARENGLNLRVTREYDDAHEVGRVFGQDAAVGTPVERGAFIGVSVSEGHDPSAELPLPDLANMTKGEIDAWAAANFMMNVSFTAVYSDSVQAGGVISFTVADSSVVDKVRRSTQIEIVVSRGRLDPASVRITVPDFRRMTAPECKSFAEDNGITLTIHEEYDDEKPKGAVTAQSVKAGETLKQGDTVTITVSLGKKVLIPDFSAYTKQSAAAVAADLGIRIVTAERYSALPAGALISQSAPAGAVYDGADTLQLVFSLGNKVLITSYVGQTRDKIEAWAKGLNDQGASIVINARYTKSNTTKDKIIFQDKANTSIGIDATVSITVSLGKAVYVPDFVAPVGSGYGVAVTCDKALALCTQLNLVPVFVASKKTGRLPGEVWYQSLAAGKEVTEGTTITLKYNPNSAALTVPDFAGMTESEILAAGYAMRLELLFETAGGYVEGYAGKVLEQSIGPGFEVAYGTAVTLTVGPEPPPSAPP